MDQPKWSVVIPTYNRLSILKKCLTALEHQDFDQSYEILVVDDGSTDDTVSFLRSHPEQFPHVKVLQQNHAAAAAARNLGIDSAQGEYIVFVDSDIIVTPDFLAGHAESLANEDRAFTYGRLINTANFDDPTAERSDFVFFPGAYFDTCNAAITKKWLIEAGKFDPEFNEYGWEDLELGVRLRKLNLKLIKCAKALGYHYHAPFNLSQIPRLLNAEEQRGRMAVKFYQKHPTLNVALMIQRTPLHLALWGLLTLGGLINDRSLRPLLQWLIASNKSEVAMEIFRIYMNWYNVCWMYANWDQELKRAN
ncbi:putative glycosyltransferase [Synechococcus sp. PCC 7502]|uniref:glycosyltransferase family 2 protein n=1 Tax=Synechococcus sp. PCC 7502 TaxID=1173263 RepID=UPI00029FBEFF|nr:glycosyltransferase [Synechococcus sp. PCC 7502]AFY74267.1 putative glycosyltransferase [Synechococcus sp. PCC 7502]